MVFRPCDQTILLRSFPRYNAAPFVEKVIRQASAYVPVLVVNDGSTDGTLEAARATARE
jgi:glycosyltransferase involved in cell wall biosynthesis